MSKGIYSNAFCDIAVCAGKSALNYDKFRGLKDTSPRIAEINQKLTFRLQWLSLSSVFFVPTKFDKAEGKLISGTGEHKRLAEDEILYHCVVEENKEGITYFAAAVEYDEHLKWNIYLYYEHQSLLDDGDHTRENIGTIPFSMLLDEELYKEMDGDRFFKKIGLEIDGNSDGPLWFHDHEAGFSFSVDA
ncbi:hypothetical protein FWG86_01145 [Candidatus Saccharibacteria bacterium]|nr:hypothetical protein [Candidatus Saccharibacteria bacterium]